MNEAQLRLICIRVLTLIVMLTALAGCSQDSPGGNMPKDPNEWVCTDSESTFTENDLKTWCGDNQGKGKPLPAFLREPYPLYELQSKNQYDQKLREFAFARLYDTELDWVRDQNVRFTGPYIGEFGKGLSYGTHAAIRIYYSPEVVDWLCGGREGALPDGAVILKEEYAFNEELDVKIDGAGCMEVGPDAKPELIGYSIMVKNEESSYDGWYWAAFFKVFGDPEPWQEGNPPVVDRSAIVNKDQFYTDGNPPAAPNPLWYPTGTDFFTKDKIPSVVYPLLEYGSYCTNCHGMAVSQSTFSAIENIAGYEMRYKHYDKVDERIPTIEESLLQKLHIPSGSKLTSSIEDVDREKLKESHLTAVLDQPDPDFLEYYNQLSEVDFQRAWELRLPAETYDHVVSTEDGPPEFMTSDQCLPCHNASYFNAKVPNMVLEDKTGAAPELVNLSVYGEWSASPMGLSGRDPVFYAQLESETNNLPELTECVETLCLHCHAVMGERAYAKDTEGADKEGCRKLFGVEPPPGVPSGAPYRLGTMKVWPGSEDNHLQKYAALGRDGVSCAACHRIAQEGLDNESAYTGNFLTGPPDELYGQYDDVIPKPMQNVLGVTPKYGSQVEDPVLCGSCHNILLPVFSNGGEQLGFKYEQTTHLEWKNSVYSKEGPEFKTCQHCHMPGTYKGEELTFKIANITSDEFPPSYNVLSDEEITLKERKGYPRHSLHGLNLFLNQMFQQFPIILGERQIDYMVGTAAVNPSLITGQDSMIYMAQNETAEVSIKEISKDINGVLSAKVEVKNLTGHFLPSGVGFRRMFLEFLLRDKEGNILWASGRTNNLGVILDGTSDRILPSEDPISFPEAQVQPHYEVITSGDEVQIYQELIKDSDGNMTTSFLRRVKEVKDNRIRPKGYDPDYYKDSSSEFIKALSYVIGQTKDDPHYTDPKLTGSDLVEYKLPLDKETMKKAHDVKVTLYNQSIPPFYLRERFRDAHRGPAEKDEITRLYYITSHLNVDDVFDEAGTPVLKDWKLYITSDTKEVD